jgi:CheY-like chemotaxis protein
MSDIAASDLQLQRRVLVHAPVGRDAVLTAQLLGRESIPHLVCHTLRELALALAAGAGVILLTEESLDEPGLEELIQTIADQGPWSDVPALLCAGSERERIGMRTLQRVRMLGNVTLLDRPIRVAVVLSTLESALRSRARQYELREVLVALREAREQADASNRLKDEFIATLSHELRTPLNAMLGWTSMLRSGQVHGALVERAFEIIERNARAQHALVADLLDVSRIITGKLTLNPTTAESNLRGVRALVVDDDPDARELVGVILREAGANPELASGASEALAMIASRPPFDVVISDIAMPQQDGYSLIAAIRAARPLRDRDILAVAFTAYASQPDEARAKQAGFDAFLAKPIEPFLLTHTLGNLLGRGKRRAHRP